MTAEKIIFAIFTAILVTLIYAIGVNVGMYKALKAIEPREMFPVMDKIADEISKDEVDKRKMSIAMLRLMSAVIEKL